MTDDSHDSPFFEGSILLIIYIIYIIINYILISYISYRGDIVGLHTLQFLTVRTVDCQIHSLCHEVVVLRSFLQVLHSEQLLGSLFAEMLIGKVRCEGWLPQGGIEIPACVSVHVQPEPLVHHLVARLRCLGPLRHSLLL